MIIRALYACLFETGALTLFRRQNITIHAQAKTTSVPIQDWQTF